MEQYTTEQIVQLKKRIDEMSQLEMCRIWRFGTSGNKYTSGEVGDYFKNRLFNILGGFTPEISKKLGWSPD